MTIRHEPRCIDALVYRHVKATWADNATGADNISLVTAWGRRRDDSLDGSAERRATAYRRDGIEECLFEALSALGWQYEDIAGVARGGTVRTGYGVPEGY